MNTPTSRASGGAADVAAAAGAALLFAAAAVVGAASYDGDVLFLAWPPLFADWRPHAGPGTPAALIAAGLVAGFGPAAARRLPWRWLLAAAWAGSMAWVWSLALVDGWERGVARRLAYGHEYLTVVDEVDGIGAFLRGFSERIPLESQDAWPAHVAGHPPGATLTFVLLDRVGLGGGAWAGAFCVTASASAAVAVLIAVRALAGEGAGRRAAPFLVLFPGAVWMGVSADGWFAAVAAWAVALLALSATRGVRCRRVAAAGSGLLWGLLLYLSYGLVLMAPVGVAVLWRARNARPLPWVLAGALPCAVAFTAGGFWWFEGYFTLVDRYHAGAGGYRPYAYFVWANLAAQVASVGLATAAGLRRAGARPRAAAGLVALVAAGAAAMLAADLSGMSKAETERIWLPFALWLTPACALLPASRARWWLALQAALALAVNHLWLTRW
ncbi:hypothetical protein RM780_06755 [Streptomyces sp. DSM 44917]|uniref:Integral membrane protein n=1 Tax=Streptomyces boetiae TaxID=3075541 RepID=A0ABU2L527_9ACTN|nr:hypothetical protein [Streptomyces sp. DSM 44917]MDT0306661.1 hypothetical protein [Streptomyces sp. DSM 44917]